MNERQKLELQTLDALRGAEDVQKRLTIEMSTGAPSIADVAYAVKIRVKTDFNIVGKVFRKRLEKSDPAYDVTRLRDIVGLRIVTLYRLDALLVIPALLEKIEGSSSDLASLFIPGSLEEVVIFSTNPTGDAQGLASRLLNIFEAKGLKDKIRVEAAPSNYTSIHMVVWCRGKYGHDYREIPVEIQVRTALEDVRDGRPSPSCNRRASFPPYRTPPGFLKGFRRCLSRFRKQMMISRRWARTITTPCSAPVASSTKACSVATRWTDYSKRSFEDATRAFEQLVGAKTMEQAFEIQSQYAKKAYDNWMAETSKLTEMYTEMARDAYRPVGQVVGKKVSQRICASV